MPRCISRIRGTPRGNGYQYQQDYPEYAPAPYQAQGPPVQHQQNSNLFVAPLAAAPFPLTHPNVQRKSKKKKREPSNSAAPVVPQPKEVLTPAPTAPLAPSQATTTPPRHKCRKMHRNRNRRSPTKNLRPRKLLLINSRELWKQL